MRERDVLPADASPTMTTFSLRTSFGTCEVSRGAPASSLIPISMDKSEGANGPGSSSIDSASALFPSSSLGVAVGIVIGRALPSNYFGCIRVATSLVLYQEAKLISSSSNQACHGRTGKEVD
mmetsp:Transcript_51710/g.155193  ORF Transcript_51710/g.155193 Transcript_51710/m.155193 type:complete len:122 (+) Transcript_51710:528-893(+)